MSALHINVFILALVGMLGWLDLLIRGSHTRLGIVSMLLIPLGFYLFLYDLFSYPHLRVIIRHGSTLDVMLLGTMFGVGVGASLANMRHGNGAFLFYGWMSLMFWGLLINIILMGCLSELAIHGGWPNGWYGLLLLENALVFAAAVYISMVAKRLYDQRTLAKQGLCPTCSYDLQDSRQAGHCPECGHARLLGGREEPS